jgi:hypothetical protein
MDAASPILPYVDAVTQAGITVARDPRVVRIDVPVQRRFAFLSLSGIRERVIFEVRADQLRVTHVSPGGTSVTAVPRAELGTIRFDPTTDKVVLPRRGQPPLELFLHPEPVIGEWAVGALDEAMRAPLQLVPTQPDTLVSKQVGEPIARRDPRWFIGFLLVGFAVALVLTGHASWVVVFVMVAMQIAWSTWLNYRTYRP